MGFQKDPKNLEFEDKSGQWISNKKGVSGATALGDLDNDGDIDMVVSNINEEVSLYINQTDNLSNYLQLKFDYPAPNTFGIGTKVYSYHEGKLQFKELYTVRGFQSSSEPMIHFGYGAVQQVDSIKVVWPNKTYQTLRNITINQQIVVSPEKTKPFNYSNQTEVQRLQLAI